jgi:hypothetical protein
LICGLFKWGLPATRRARNWWWVRLELQNPREHELGYHDHRARLRKLWVRLSYLRRDVYVLLTAIGRLTDGIAQKKETASAKFWARLAARMDPKVDKLEACATEMSELTERMLSSFKVVCGRSTQASLGVLKLFTENDPSTLQWQMKEDVVSLLTARLRFKALKGEKFEVNRVCDRIDAAVEAISKSNIAVFGACEAVIEGAKLPQPKLDSLRVRAKRPGVYANGRRRLGDVFYIRSDDEFSSEWMEKIDDEEAR